MPKSRKRAPKTVRRRPRTEWGRRHPGVRRTKENVRIASMMAKYWGSFSRGYLRRLTPRAKYWLYLRSPRWHELRAAVVVRSRGTCEYCENRPLREVHHLDYPDELGFERKSMLLGVCRGCHVGLHQKSLSRGPGHGGGERRPGKPKRTRV